MAHRRRRAANAGNVARELLSPFRPSGSHQPPWRRDRTRWKFVTVAGGHLKPGDPHSLGQERVSSAWQVSEAADAHMMSKGSLPLRLLTAISIDPDRASDAAPLERQQPR